MVKWQTAVTEYDKICYSLGDYINESTYTMAWAWMNKLWFSFDIVIYIRAEIYHLGGPEGRRIAKGCNSTICQEVLHNYGVFGMDHG